MFRNWTSLEWNKIQKEIEIYFVKKAVQQSEKVIKYF